MITFLHSQADYWHMGQSVACAIHLPNPTPSFPLLPSSLTHPPTRQRSISGDQGSHVIKQVAGHSDRRTDCWPRSSTSEAGITPSTWESRRCPLLTLLTPADPAMCEGSVIHSMFPSGAGQVDGPQATC